MSADEDVSEPTASWYDDAPITAAQYAGVWDSAMVVQERPSYSRHIVRKLLAEIDRQRAQTASLRQHWGVQAEHSTSAFPARTQELAQQMAAMYSRIREPGCRPTPHYVVARFEGDWQRVADTEQQPERSGDHG